MACGDKYRYLVVTGSGLSLEDPTGWLGTWADYEEWLDLARRLSVQANERFNVLGEVEGQATGNSSYPRWNALVDLNNRMTTRYSDLPKFFTTDWPSTTIQQAQAVIFDALCLMEKSDDGIRAYGGAVPPTPGVTPTPGELPPSETETPGWLRWVIVGGSIIAVGAAVTAVALKIRRPAIARNPRRRRNRKRSSTGDDAAAVA